MIGARAIGDRRSYSGDVSSSRDFGCTYTLFSYLYVHMCIQYVYNLAVRAPYTLNTGRHKHVRVNLAARVAGTLFGNVRISWRNGEDERTNTRRTRFSMSLRSYVLHFRLTGGKSESESESEREEKARFPLLPRHTRRTTTTCVFALRAR